MDESLSLCVAPCVNADVMTDQRNTRFLLCSMLLALSAGSLAVPSASQDGANEGFLLFTSDRANPSTDGTCPDCEDIYMMAPDGSTPTRLTFGGADMVVGGPPYNSSSADWSHSKKLIAFQSNRVGGTPQIYLMNVDGSDPQVLVSIPRGGAFPSFSSSGNELCFHSLTMGRRDIYIVNVHGTGLTNLTSPDRAPGEAGIAGDNFRCDWSPKSNTIAFNSNRHDPVGTRKEEIYVMNADGSDLVRLTNALGSDVNPEWSPKGDRIAFESNRTGRPQIWVMDADGGHQTQLTFFEAESDPLRVNVSNPTWSPKGDRIAFHRRVGLTTEDGHLEVYTMNADGSGITKITTTRFPGFSGFPTWGKWSAQ